MYGCRAVSRLGGSVSESLSCIPHVHDAVYSIWVFSYLLMSVQHFGQCEFFCIVLKQSKISLVALFPSFNISDQCGVKDYICFIHYCQGTVTSDLWPHCYCSLQRLQYQDHMRSKSNILLYCLNSVSYTPFPTGHIEQQNRHKPEPTTGKRHQNLFYGNIETQVSDPKL